MAGLFPRLDTLYNSFDNPYASGLLRKANGTTPLQARMELYPAYSISDDTKSKAKKLSEEAVKEFNAASKKAQAATGGIELFSPKYYAACTFGGLLACVS